MEDAFAKFIGIALIVVVFDRLVPLSMFLYGFTSFKTGLKDVYRSYKLVSVPRTFLGFCTCVPCFLGIFLPSHEDIWNIATIGFWLMFIVIAGFDGFRAVRSGGYREPMFPVRKDRP
jgi:hypothetical protein